MANSSKVNVEAALEFRTYYNVVVQNFSYYTTGTHRPLGNRYIWFFLRRNKILCTKIDVLSMSLKFIQ